MLKYRIDKKGRVADAIILQHPRFKEFADSSLKAVRSWRFQPLTINGEPRELIHEMRVNFRIEKPYERPPRAAKGPRADKPGEGRPGGPAGPGPGGQLGPGRQNKRP